MEDHQPAEASPEQQKKHVLITSKQLGPPPYVLDPKDLESAFNPFPGHAGFREVDDDTLVKYGSRVTLAEAEAMNFVYNSTSIKCPKVLGAYILDNTGYILMSFEKGQSLASFWESSSDEDKDTVIGHLKRYLSEMRGIKGDYVGGFNRSGCVAREFEWDYDQSDDHQYGPYPDEYGFNEGILEALHRAHPGPANEDEESTGYNNIYAIRQLVHSLRNHEIVFTHGDLHTGNILVQDDLTVVILDWYTAGFFPEYWEWYKATSHGFYKPSFIRQVERYIPPFWIEANIMDYVFDKIIGFVALPVDVPQRRLTTKNLSSAPCPL
ncbi:kinase-like protein [Nemania serpens]|nr:kinase-like protein [Nemania serpens]